MSVVSVIPFVGVTVLVLLWIPLTQCFSIQTSYKKLITSNIPHNVGTINCSAQDFNTSNEITSSNITDIRSNNISDIRHNDERTNASIPNSSNLYEITLNNLDGEMSQTQVLESDSAKCPGCSCGRKNRKKRIIGGVVAEPNEFPWKAMLLHKGNFHCAATIITRRHLLTAGHCVNNTAFNLTITEMQAVLGRHNRWVNESYEVMVGIEEIIQHSEFQVLNSTLDETPAKNDIAILKLKSSISFNTSYILPSCLPNSENRNYTGLNAVAIGWGLVNESTKLLSSMLRKVEVPIISIEDCRKNYNDISADITDRMICADNSGQKDSCRGDSGGPIQISSTMEVIGITIWGRGCAQLNSPGIYTYIAKYLPWIKENIDGECLCSD